MIGRWLVRSSVCIMCVSFAAPVVAQVILDAEPTVRLDSTTDSSKRRVLSPVERAKSRVIVVKKDGKYLWASRGGRELVHNASGAFHYFVDPLGSGYVKVQDTQLMGFPNQGLRYRFMEHVTIHLASFTYWGTSEKFDPTGGD